VILPLIWGWDQHRQLRQINTTRKSRARGFSDVKPQVWCSRRTSASVRIADIWLDVHHVR